MKIELIKKQEAADILGVATETLSRYRREGQLIEGVHYYKMNSRTFRYNKEMIINHSLLAGTPEYKNRMIEHLKKQQDYKKGTLKLDTLA